MRIPSPLLKALALAAASTLMSAAPRAAKPSTIATEMMIIDPPADRPGLFGDGRGLVAPNLYIDSSLPGGDVCAQGSVNQTGYSVFYPDIWYSDESTCNATVLVSEPSKRRTYIFNFPAGDSSGPCTVLLGLPAGSTCSITTDDTNKERIILGGLFGAKAKTTSVQMGLHLPNNPQGYSLLTDGSATIVFDTNPSIRTAVYSGTAKLYPVINGSPSSTPATSSFSFPIQIRIQEGS
jgi:hypothetical protein